MRVLSDDAPSPEILALTETVTRIHNAIMRSAMNKSDARFYAKLRHARRVLSHIAEHIDGIHDTREGKDIRKDKNR